MTRQYIGPRFVPDFYKNSNDPTSTQWENNVTYGPLTWVSLANGNMYLSKKTVPSAIGSPASNPEYWMEAGQFNAYIQLLQDQIGDLNNLKSPEDADLVTAINSLARKKYIFIGDSYAHASGGGNGWLDQIIPLMGIGNDEYYEATIGGGAFTAGVGYSFLELIQGLYSSITDKDSITDIVVLGGTNDVSASNEGTITTAVNTFIAYCNQNYPNAKVRLGCIFGTTNPSFIGWRYDMVVRAYSSCKNAEFMNNLQYVLHNYSLIQSDGIHPTAMGYTILSNKISDALQGGCSVNYYENGVITPDTGWTDVQNYFNKFSASINNNLASLEIYPRIGIQSTDASYNKSVTYASNVKIGTLDSDLIKGVQSNSYDQYQYVKMACYAMLRWAADSSQHIVHGNLQLYQNNLYFISYDSALGSSSNYQNIDRIDIYPTPITLNSLYC